MPRRLVLPPLSFGRRPPARLRRPKDARADTIYRVEQAVVETRRLSEAGDLYVDALRAVVARRPLEVFAYSVRSDGYILLLRALDDRLPAALRDLHSRVARGLNERTGTGGSLWAGRVAYRSMRHHPEAVAALVDILIAPVLRGAVEHPADHPLPASYGALVQRRPDPVQHTALPWFGTMDDVTIAHRLRGAIDARLMAARAWSLAG